MQCLYIYDAPNACMLCSFPKSTCKHALAMSQPHGQHATCTCHCSRHCAALKSMLQNVFPLYTFKKATFKSKNALMLQEHAKIWTHKEHAKSIQSSRLRTAPSEHELPVQELLDMYSILFGSLGHLGLHGESGLVSQLCSEGLIASREFLARRRLLRLPF